MSSPQSVAAFLYHYFEKLLKARGINSVETISDDLDFFESGLLDSLGFVQLIAELQQTYCAEIDISDADVQQISRYKPFCAFIERKLAESGKQS